MIKNIAYVGAFTLFVVIIWVALSIYTSLTSPTIPTNVESQIKPLDDSFNTNIINSLKERRQVSSDLSKLPPAPSITPEANENLRVITSPTPSITIIPTNTATSSGKIQPNL